ncbi:MAG TPA: hypothetical protein VFV13_09115 [Acidimicrobiia bacterium]|nr:hypothetical protein [Acidimicrobiia bacterium]
MTSRKGEAILLATLVAILAACGSGTDPDAVGDATTVAVTTPTTESDTTMPSNEQLPIVAPAIDDLAQRLGSSSDAIEVVSAEEVTWPDGSLGCPEPGMSYTQALVDGSKVVLRHEDRVFVYHAGDDDQPFLCASKDKDGGHEFLPPPGFNE